MSRLRETGRSDARAREEEQSEGRALFTVASLPCDTTWRALLLLPLLLPLRWRLTLLLGPLDSGADPTMPRGSKMSPMKKFMEARMGKFYSDVSLKQFLLNDKKVLRFFTVWDDRKSLGGELHMYTINMYLADCTCEVLERFEKNSGSVPFRGFR